jgi:hypothetical protein
MKDKISVGIDISYKKRMQHASTPFEENLFRQAFVQGVVEAALPRMGGNPNPMNGGGAANSVPGTNNPPPPSGGGSLLSNLFGNVGLMFLIVLVVVWTMIRSFQTLEMDVKHLQERQNSTLTYDMTRNLIRLSDKENTSFMKQALDSTIRKCSNHKDSASPQFWFKTLQGEYAHITSEQIGPDDEVDEEF